MSATLLHLIAAARPNFMKVAPLHHRLGRETWCRTELVHTGQHYDANMSDAFFRDLGLPEPDHHLGVGSGSHAEQTGGVMIAYERLCRAARPDWIIVVGDVNSTMACTLVGAKLGIKVAHLEAGLRSRDRTMPEEINRLVTDAVADLLWTPSSDADENLRHEGVPEERVERVGNIMIDSYELLRPAIEASRTRERFALPRHGYGVATLHRPANVDHEQSLRQLINELGAVSQNVPVVFPVHPRTRQRMASFGLSVAEWPALILTQPMGYIEFMGLVSDAGFIVTDSGGVQEETTYLGIPCLTMRSSTERPITVTQGTNQLVRVHQLRAKVAQVLDGAWPKGRVPELWDGHAAEWVARSLKAHTK